MKNLIVLIFIFLIACNNNTNQVVETMTTGSIHISVESAFKPVFIELINVFQSQYPKVKIYAEYKSESECFKDFQQDSTRLIIVSRPLNMDEFNTFKKYLRYAPRNDIVAYSAIATIINKASKDTQFTWQNLQQILLGKDAKKVVVDGNNLTSTIRFLKDSILQNKEYGTNVLAAKNSEDLLNIISKNNDYIGFVGYNWLNNMDDQKHKKYFEKLTYAAIECNSCNEKGIFAKPAQNTIGMGYYSLTIPVFYILKENFAGVGSNFINFLTLESGQLIFKKSLFLPAKINFYKRNTKLS